MKKTKKTQEKKATYKEGEIYQLQEKGLYRKETRAKDCIIVKEYERFITMKDKKLGYPVTIEKYKLLNGEAKLIRKAE